MITEVQLKPIITGLAASIVIQFAFSSAFVVLFGGYKKGIGGGQDDTEDIESTYPTNPPWGYKVGLLLTIPGFVTLIIAMVFLGFAEDLSSSPVTAK